MKLDRRRFIQLGAMTVVSASACGNPPSGNEPKGSGAAAAPSGSADVLTVRLKGLYLVEYGGPSATVHILDGPSLGLPRHTGLLKIEATFIDQTRTAKPDPAHVSGGGGIETWTWDLKGTIAMPMSPSGVDDLVLPPASSPEDTQDVPSDAGWNSFHRLPDLKTACDATSITNRQYIASSISLTHGTLRILKPADAVGSGSIWKFTSPSGQQIFRGALSDNLEYTCPTNGQSLVITVGTYTIALKPTAAVADVDNQVLAKPTPCGPGCTPNMNHFMAFCKVVDSKADPTITLAARVTAQGDQAGPDYCPGAGMCKGC